MIHFLLLCVYLHYAYVELSLSIYMWLYSPLLDLGRFFYFLQLFTQSVGLLGRGISPSQGLCQHTEQHKSE
jgi:hypothetical protein